jgi:hypothetical protein
MSSWRRVAARAQPSFHLPLSSTFSFTSSRLTRGALVSSLKSPKWRCNHSSSTPLSSSHTDRPSFVLFDSLSNTFKPVPTFENTRWIRLSVVYMWSNCLRCHSFRSRANLCVDGHSSSRLGTHASNCKSSCTVIRHEYNGCG